MKFDIIFSLTCLLVSGALALPDSNPGNPLDIAGIDPSRVPGASGVEHGEVERRACTPNCKCRPGSVRGQYCGYCLAVSEGWVLDHVYECSPSGSCCDYGVRNSCKTYSETCPI